MKKSNDNGLSRAEFQYLTPPDNEAPRTKQRPKSQAPESGLLFPPAQDVEASVTRSIDEFSAEYIQAFISACNPLLSSEEIAQGVQKALEQGSYTIGGCALSFEDDAEYLELLDLNWKLYIMNLS